MYSTVRSDWLYMLNVKIYFMQKFIKSSREIHRAKNRPGVAPAAIFPELKALKNFAFDDAFSQKVFFFQNASIDRGRSVFVTKGGFWACSTALIHTKDLIEISSICTQCCTDWWCVRWVTFWFFLLYYFVIATGADRADYLTALTSLQSCCQCSLNPMWACFIPWCFKGVASTMVVHSRLFTQYLLLSWKIIT